MKIYGNICHRHPKNATYVSKTTQNALIEIIGTRILKKIIDEINIGSKFYSLQADELQDISNKEQLSMAVRYVDEKCNPTIAIRFECILFTFKIMVVYSANHLSLTLIIYN